MAPLTEASTRAQDCHSEALLACAPHPLQVKPGGNAYTASGNIRSAAGRFSRLSDELIVCILEHLDGPALQQIGSSCKALYAFARLDDLWKALFIGYISSSSRAHRALLSPSRSMVDC